MELRVALMIFSIDNIFPLLGYFTHLPPQGLKLQEIVCLANPWHGRPPASATTSTCLDLVLSPWPQDLLHCENSAYAVHLQSPS